MKELWVDTSATDYFADDCFDFTGSLKDDIAFISKRSIMLNR
jgi:hypothetical protein